MGIRSITKSTHATPRSDPSTELRTSTQGMPFDKLKAPSIAEGLRVDTERCFLPRFKYRGLALSNVSSESFQRASLNQAFAISKESCSSSYLRGLIITSIPTFTSSGFISFAIRANSFRPPPKSTTPIE